MPENEDLYKRMRKFLNEAREEADRTAHVNGKDKLHYTLNWLEKELDEYKEEEKYKLTDVVN